MNKRDKEVIAYQLEDEKKVLRELKRQYERSLLTIESKIKLLQSGEMTQSKIYQINYQKALKAQVDAILDKLQADEYDTIQQYLDRSYTDGYVGAMYQIGGSGVNVIVPIDQDAAAKAIITDSKLSVELYASLGYDMDKLKKSVRDEITRGISASLSYEEIARNLSEYSTVALSNANRIVRTEAHRIQQASADDARLAAKAKGADVVKQWDASLDGKTRPMHRELDGQIREVGEPFEVGGEKVKLGKDNDKDGTIQVMYPGKFGTADQDCNCRCVALTRARWALDEDELAVMKERAKAFGLDKTKNFKEYKQKYLKAARTVKTPGNIGEKAIPYSKRGIPIDERIKKIMKDLPEPGRYVSSKAGSYTTEDIAILTTETGVEYTRLTIGEKEYLIRGTEKGTTIPEELFEELIKYKGTLDYHSHPYIGDIMPSKSDREVLKTLIWQEKSGIIDPRGEVYRFDAEGYIEPEKAEKQRDANFYEKLFGGDD